MNREKIDLIGTKIPINCERIDLVGILELKIPINHKKIDFTGTKIPMNRGKISFIGIFGKEIFAFSKI